MHAQLALAATLVAGIAPMAFGGAAAVAAPVTVRTGTTAEPGTVVQEGGRLTVPAGRGPVTTRLTVTLPPGTTGPLRSARITFQAAGDTESRPSEQFTSTCSVNGGAAASCAWFSPDPETVDGTWLVLDLPAAEVPAGTSTVTYDITVAVTEGMEWLSRLSGTVELHDATGPVARGNMALDIVPGTIEAWHRSSLHARDRDGVLWQYDATGRADAPFAKRKRVGGGWNVYTAITKLDRTTAERNEGALVARDRNGVLWYYPGNRRPDAPFKPRERVGGGWNVYTSIVGLSGGDLVARDRTGVLWFYEGRGPGVTGAYAFHPRVRVGGGWNAYSAIASFGEGLVAHTAAGRQFRYEKSDDRGPSAPFKPRREVGGGWNRYTALTGMGLVLEDPSLAARTADGKLVVYGVDRWKGNSDPYRPRPVGGGWNIYDTLV
ncbi:tachylectin-related carbohydrate-binding protein [Streptomyces sp. NBC_00233]|uniref:tachylectin-related carbohydrate-binding protein n=1 Tax=Streptomyces sp. NBC_00233 TaxID=2975686 RepID=UPI00225BFBD1|nr:tachylectin-related carbohydrate-binding protein [Streptomyces sp. NBC_00233]MCX5226328.1 tachylectin-related carbohydrate-binding protein [Streptomyces sp. NBC_00233]